MTDHSSTGLGGLGLALILAVGGAVSWEALKGWIDRRKKRRAD